jgi:O-acetylserine/cysteine efflux transporter
MRISHLLLALLCVLVWGGSFAVIQWGLHDLPPLAFASLRFATVAVLALLLPRPAVPIRLLLMYGFTWGAVQFGALFLAIYAGMPTGLSSVLAQSQVLFTLLLATLFGFERLRLQHLLGMALACGGLTCIVTDSAYPVPILALLCSLIGALGWAAGNLVVRHLQMSGHRPDSTAFIAWASILPTLCLALASLLWEPHQTLTFEQGQWLPALLAILYQGIVALLLGTLAWNRLLRHYPASRVAPFSLLVPVVGLSIGVGMLGESLSLLQFSGCLLLLGAVLVNLLQPLRPPRLAQQLH